VWGHVSTNGCLSHLSTQVLVGAGRAMCLAYMSCLYVSTQVLAGAGRAMSSWISVVLKEGWSVEWWPRVTGAREGIAARAKQPGATSSPSPKWASTAGLNNKL
jgi:hypothetical protein